MDPEEKIISKKIDSRFYELHTSHIQETNNDQMKIIYIWENFNGNFKEKLDLIIKDLKKNQIHTEYDNEYKDETVNITAAPETINLLKENLKKLYLIEEKDNHIIIKDYKVYFPYGVEGYYDARDDSLHLDTSNPNYNCIRSTTNTEWGEKIIYSCKHEWEE